MPSLRIPRLKPMTRDEAYQSTKGTVLSVAFGGMALPVAEALANGSSPTAKAGLVFASLVGASLMTMQGAGLRARIAPFCASAVMAVGNGAYFHYAEQTKQHRLERATEIPANAPIPAHVVYCGPDEIGMKLVDTKRKINCPGPGTAP